MSFNRGLSRTIRDAGAPRSAGGGLVSESGLAPGLMIGEVMDDQDEQRSGRVWVSVPGYTSRKVDSPTTRPNWRGTVPDRRSGQLEYDQKLRMNWILCQPISSFMGSDERRADFTVDGRNSYRGDVSSYGTFSQPRIGDQVAIMFLGGDPNVAFYIGCLTKPNQGRMVPGSPGYSPRNIVDGSDEKEKTTQAVAISGYDNAFGSSVVTDTKTGRVVEREDQTNKLPSHTQARTAIIGGHAYDIHRGPGTSSMKRESPSYVTGTKTPGWNYETERYNTNMDGGQFGDNPGRYRYINTTGHSFVMDDHPEHQMIRIRTSGGSQILMNDSSDNPYIYVSTAKGNVWMEFTDEGKVQFYSKDSFSYHSGKDINFVADRDINFEAFGDINVLARKNYRMTIGEETHLAFNGDYKALYQKDSDETRLGYFYENIEKDHHVKIGLEYIAEIGKGKSEKIGDSSIMKASGPIYIMGEGLASLEAPRIWLNSGITTETKSAEKATKPKFGELTKKYDAPVKEEVLQGKTPPKIKYLAPVVPQHQPWAGREGVTSSGTTGRCSPLSIPGASPQLGPAGSGEYGATNTFTGTTANENRRSGAIQSYAKRPDDTVGAGMGQWIDRDMSFNNTSIFNAGLILASFWPSVRREPSQVAIWRGTTDYQTTNVQEAPVMTFERMLKPGEIAPTNSYKISETTKDYIRTNEKLSQFPEVIDETTVIIGRGHRIKIGETIDSMLVTADVYQSWINGGVTTTLTYLTPEEADDLFDQDIAVYETYIRDNISVYITQGQFDGLVSFAYHDQAMANPRGQTQNVIKAVNNGRMDIAQELMSQSVYVDGALYGDIVIRRQEERAIMNTIPNDAMDYTGTEWTPVGDKVQLGGVSVYEAVKTAIDAAATEYSIDSRFLYAMCAQESGFNPNAFNTASGQKGLFQFPTEVAFQYGIADTVYQPDENADAAGRYIVDARDTFKRVNETEDDPTLTDLYMQLCMGQEVGAKFVGFVQTNPSGKAVETVDGLVRGLVDAMPTVFKTYDGESRTNAEVYDLMASVLNSRMNLFNS